MLKLDLWKRVKTIAEALSLCPYNEVRYDKVILHNSLPVRMNPYNHIAKNIQIIDIYYIVLLPEYFICPSITFN